MESTYGIGINNRYALFLDADEDGFGAEEIIAKKAQNAVSVKKTLASAAKVTAAPSEKKDVTRPSAAKDSNKAVNNREDKENRNNQSRRPRDRSPKEDQREEKNNRRNRVERSEGGGGGGGSGSGSGSGGIQVERFDGEARGRGRGGRGARGGRGRGVGGRTKREFERKSGDDRTGVKAVEKREGSGSHNWGTFEDEIKAEQDNANNTSLDESATAAPASATGQQKHTADREDRSGEEKTEEPREEEPKTFTLDEWRAQQGEKSGPKFNTRKAGEGSDFDPKWKKTYAYKKEKETHEDEEEEESELYPQRVNRQRRILDIEFNFTDIGRGGGGGGGGGRGRGGPRGSGPGRGRDRRTPQDTGGRGDRRGGYNGGAANGGGGYGGGGPSAGSRRGGANRGAKFEAPNFNDEASFPSLG